MLPLRPLPSVFSSSLLSHHVRALSTLPNNPHIYYFQTSNSSSSSPKLLSLLPSDPPNPSLALGSTTAIPPTPDSLTENPHFLQVLHSVLREQAPHDPNVRAQASAMGASGGISPSFGFPQNHPSTASKRQRSANRQTLSDRSHDTGAGAASKQGGPGGGGRGGWIHVSDLRHPPDFGRIAEPEDIFGSLEVDGSGEFVGAGQGGHVGRYQESGTYRMVTREGILGLSPFLRERLVERLKELEAQCE